MSKLIPPKKLYKYRCFDEYTLRLFTKQIYYSKPVDFNDPLDCKPTINIDTDRDSLENLCFKMLADRYGQDHATRELGEINHIPPEIGDNHVGLNTARYYMNRMAECIKNLLYDEMGSYGVLSLAEKWDCPLMWSHYADNHKGLCFEYDTVRNTFFNISAVDYNRPRSINVSELIDWKISKSSEAKELIKNIYFYTKARNWRYEHEWRDLNNTSGSMVAPTEISAVYFGMRCDNTIVNMVQALYSKANKSIQLYKIESDIKSFKLKKRKIEDRENGEPPYISLFSSALDFEDLTLND